MLPARLAALAVLAVLAVLPACAAESAATDGAASTIDVAKLEAYLAALPPDQEVIVVDGETEAIIDPTAALQVYQHELDEQYLVQQNAFTVCDCTTEACLAAWADQQAGCGYCVVFLCEDQPQHVCIPCDEP